MKITVTAGHGAGDPGAVEPGGVREAELMADLRNIVALKLRSMIDHTADEPLHEVRTDGTRVTNLPLAKALLLVPGSDVAIELHTNAFTNRSAGGVECIALPRQKLMAQKISAGIARVLEIPLRGEKGWIDQSKSARGRLAFVNAGGIIVEVFFLSNPSELTKYEKSKWMVATAIVEAITS